MITETILKSVKVGNKTLTVTRVTSTFEGVESEAVFHITGVNSSYRSLCYYEGEAMRYFEAALERAQAEEEALKAQVVATAPVRNKTHFVTVTVSSSRVNVKADFQTRRYPRDMSMNRLEDAVSCLNKFIQNEFEFTVDSVVTAMGDIHCEIKAIITVK